MTRSFLLDNKKFNQSIKWYHGRTTMFQTSLMMFAFVSATIRHNGSIIKMLFEKTPMDCQWFPSTSKMIGNVNKIKLKHCTIMKKSKILDEWQP